MNAERRREEIMPDWDGGYETAVCIKLINLNSRGFASIIEIKVDGKKIEQTPENLLDDGYTVNAKYRFFKRTQTLEIGSLQKDSKQIILKFEDEDGNVYEQIVECNGHPTLEIKKPTLIKKAFL